MIKLYQAEWCPHSHKIRQRLTELGVPYIAMPVSTVPENRKDLITETGQNSIPAIVLEDGRAIFGKDKVILAELNAIFPETPETETHKTKAVKNSHKLGYTD